jgi:predicted nucleotidyltransferase
MDFARPLQTIGPSLDGDVLAVLARADAELTGRELHRLIGHSSETGVRRAADRLVLQGIVLRRPAGHSHLYRLNRDHLAAPWVEGLAGLREQALERLRERIDSWKQPPLVAVLFGSGARGEAHPASDLDLFVVRRAGVDPDTDPWNAQLVELERDATAWTGNDARVVEFAEEEIGGETLEPVVEDVMREGLELYGSLRTLQRLAKAGERRG